MIERLYIATFVGCLLFLGVTVIPAVRENRFQDRVRGRIVLQVESAGEAWYVHPTTLTRYYLGRPADAFRVMREQSIGISNADLFRLFSDTPAINGAYTVNDIALAKRLAGLILLAVENRGEAYYLAPHTMKGYYLGRPADAFRVMSSLGLGIRNKDVERISY